MCTVVLPPGVNAIAVNKYIVSCLISRTCESSTDHGEPTDTRLQPLSTEQQRRKSSHMVRVNSRGHQ